MTTVTTVTTETADSLLEQVLLERVRQPRRMAQRVQALKAHVGDAADWRLRLLALQAMAAHHAGDVHTARPLAQTALSEALAQGDGAAAAIGQWVLAGCMLALGDLAQAHELALRSLTAPDSVSTPLWFCLKYGRLCTIEQRLGRAEDALRWAYRAVAAAAECGDAATEAQARGSLGGLQLSMNNLEDAQALCAGAWALLQNPQGRQWAQAWSLVAMNHLLTLVALGRIDQAMPVAREVWAGESEFAPETLFRRRLLLAEVFARAGELKDAQGLADGGLEASPLPHAPPVEWVRAQSQIWLAQGRHGEVLRICDDHLLRGARDELAEADLPQDVVRLHMARAHALESLGDAVGALHAERAAMRTERETTLAANSARRLTLQISYELDEARRRQEQAAQEQARLAALNLALTQANDAKSRFLAAASHDLRQPLHALGLLLAELQASTLEPKTQLQAQHMENVLGSLQGMLNALLDLSRMDAGVVPVRAAGLRLRPFLARILNEVSPLAQSKGLSLRLRVPGHALAHVDATLLESMLRNVIGNAVKYTQQGGALVCVRAHQAAQGQQWRVQVWDTGQGIAEQYLDKVFDEFFQIQAHANESEGGLGLGLAIVKRLAQLQGLALTLHSTVGRGTCVSIDLPLADADAAVEAPDELTSNEPVLRIACIEDDAAVLNSQVSLLRRWGHQVWGGASAHEVRNTPGCADTFDLVIADYTLDGPHTGDVQARTLAQGKATRVLLVTGETAPERLRELAACGLPWLTKPVPPAKLRSWLSTVPVLADASGSTGATELVQ